jgi:hypothetical protein
MITQVVAIWTFVHVDPFIAFREASGWNVRLSR